MSSWAEIIENDLSWREAELASLKRVAITSTENTVLHKSVLRANWAMLYAHFEGFTKFCWDVLLDSVEKSGKSIKDLNNNFLLLSLEKEFKKVRGSLDSKSLYEFFTTGLPLEVEKIPSFHSECRLSPNDNLYPNIFEKENKKVGIICEELEKSRLRIKTLVSRRNSIAHGEKMTIKDVKEYTEYETTTLCLMHELGLKVIELLDKELYKNS